MHFCIFFPEFDHASLAEHHNSSFTRGEATSVSTFSTTFSTSFAFNFRSTFDFIRDHASTTFPTSFVHEGRGDFGFNVFNYFFDFRRRKFPLQLRLATTFLTLFVHKGRGDFGFKVFDCFFNFGRFKFLLQLWLDYVFDFLRSMRREFTSISTFRLRFRLHSPPRSTSWALATSTSSPTMEGDQEPCQKFLVFIAVTRTYGLQWLNRSLQTAVPQITK